MLSERDFLTFRIFMLGSQVDDITLRHHLPYTRRNPAIQGRSLPQSGQRADGRIHIPPRQLAIQLKCLHLHANLPRTMDTIERIILTFLITIVNVVPEILHCEVRTTKVRASVRGEFEVASNEAQIDSCP